MVRIGVVIVTHASDDLLPGLLEALQTHEPDAHVVVVDSASPGGPPDVGTAELLACSENRGYAAAANRGAAALAPLGCDHLAFLQPDVRITGPTLTELADALDRRPDVGIATGPVVDPDGRRLPAAWGPTSVRRALVFAAGFEPVRMRSAAGAMLRRVPVSDVSRVQDDIAVEGHVGGGTMMVRRACFDEVGGFDEEFFLYWEDADLCARARHDGWGVRLLPCTPFVDIDAGTGTNLADDEVRWTHFSSGAMRFGAKHLVPGQARQLEAALDLGRRLKQVRERG
jgi:N-acetylglucosaminyl-diphospho-decaprenol L-rhamnosyltransferase